MDVGKYKIIDTNTFYDKKTKMHIVALNLQPIGYERYGSDWEHFDYLEFKQKIIGFSYEYLEILVGSFLIANFVSVQNGNPISNNYTIELENNFTFNQLKIFKKDLIKPLKEIYGVTFLAWESLKYNKDYVRIYADGENGFVPIPPICAKYLESLSGIPKDKFYLLKKSFVQPQYYDVGEKMNSGQKCTESKRYLNKIFFRPKTSINEILASEGANEERLLEDFSFKKKHLSEMVQLMKKNYKDENL